MSSHTTEYYFESHITIDPVLEESKTAALKLLVKLLGFKVAKLFMQKGKVSFTRLAIRNGSEFEFLTQQQRYEVML